MTSYIISRETLVAQTENSRTSGESVRFSRAVCAEAIDASREFNLVNARSGTISNAKKWATAARRIAYVAIAREVNPGEFQIL